MNGRYEFWNPDTLGYKFLAEAKRIWEVEMHNDGSITTVQAALIINLIYNLYAMDKVGMSYGIAAVQLADQLNLFAAHDDSPSMSEVQRHGYTYTAWSIFFWFRYVGSN